MKAQPDRNRRIAKRRAEGASFKDLAAEFTLSTTRVKTIVDAVARYNLGVAFLMADPWSLEGLALTGKNSMLARLSLEARGMTRISDLKGNTLVDLLRLPNINRRAATSLMELYERYEQSGSLGHMAHKEQRG
jgi:hypothetical protein